MKTNHGTTLTRRAMLKKTAFAGTATVVASMINLGRSRPFSRSPIEYSTRTIDLLKRSTVIDMLSPLTLNFPKQAKWFADPESFTTADLQPYKDSGINVFHTAIGIGGTDAYLESGYKGSYGFREKIDIEGLNHPKRVFDLTEGLIRRKYSDKEIEGILGGNFKRVLSQIWSI